MGDRLLDRTLMQIANTVATTRTRLAKAIGITHDQERDLWEVFGYPRNIQIKTLHERYRRGGIEQRIIRAFPKASWRTPPAVSDDDDPERKSPFEEAVEALNRSHRIWHYLERADRLSGIGRYGVLFMGFNDGRQPSEPLAPGRAAKLMFLRPFSEVSATINSYVTDATDARYGLPKAYSLETGGLTADRNRQTMGVHHSRILHLTEFPEEDEIFGTPRLESIYNRLLDLEKVIGGSAEGFWLNANAAIAMIAQADANLTEPDIERMQEQAEEYQHQLRRILALQGVDIKQLRVQLADPSNQINAQLKLIAGAVGMPLRILIGNEQGELASSSDDTNWSAQIDERRETYLIPRVVRPFIDHMIETGVLPEPKDGDYTAGWEENDTMDPKDRATIGLNKTQALVAYANAPIAETIMPASEFRETILGVDPFPEGGFPEDVEPDDEGDIDPNSVDDEDEEAA